MKSKKNILIIVLATLVAVRIMIVIFEKKADHSIAPFSAISNVETTPLNPDVNLSKAPEEAVTSQNASISQDENCEIMFSQYKNLSEVQKVEKTSIRFVNIHKDVNGEIYRTRFFYKDASENEIPTYLLYKEDQHGVDHLIETSPYKKGKQYLKIEKALGSIIYTEEGVNVGVEQELFLHYENKALKDLQGIHALSPEKNFIECRY